MRRSKNKGRVTGQIELFTRRVRALPPVAEFATQCMIADLLTRWAKPGWQWTHLPMGEYRTAATAARLKRMGVKPGWPDLILISPLGLVHFLELKRARRGRMTPAQTEFANWCKAHHVVHVVADSFDAALGYLTGWGVLRISIEGVKTNAGRIHDQS